MHRMKILSFALTFVSLCTPGNGQAIKQTVVNAASPKEKPIPQGERPKPYFSDSQDRQMRTIEFRTVDQMTERDRLIAANAEGSISEHAKYTPLEFNEGQWSYEQVVCPALPNHIFLRFLRNNGTGDVSVFTASIPRGEAGRVRIIPIQLRGYSLFSPAPINAVTISTFNHIRDEEYPDPDGSPGKDPDWLGTALCYGALAGGHPQAARLSEHPETEPHPIASTATLDIGAEGGAVLSYTDVTAQPRPMKWTMDFDKKGRLVKGSHTSADLLSVTTVHPLQVNKVGPPRPMSEPKMTKINAPAQPVVKQVPPAPAPKVTVISASKPPQS